MTVSEKVGANQRQHACHHAGNHNLGGDSQEEQISCGHFELIRLINFGPDVLLLGFRLRDKSLRECIRFSEAASCLAQAPVRVRPKFVA